MNLPGRRRLRLPQARYIFLSIRKPRQMNPKDITAWLRIGVDTWALGWQAARVVSMRSARIAAGGPAAGLETWLMLSEKWQSAVEIQSDLLSRGPGANPATTTRRTLAHLKRKVAANDRRLR